MMRQRAFEAIARARSELESGDRNRLHYAALELRFALEALTYDLASLYTDELPKSEIEAWQPRKVMEALLAVDPDADKEVTIAVGLEVTPGEPAPEMHVFGQEKKVTLKGIKAHYAALGNFLHAPTLRQISEGGHDYDKMRSRCIAVLDYLADIKDSPIWHVSAGFNAEAQCCRCESMVRRRIPFGVKGPAQAVCQGCGATYTVTDKGGNVAHFTPNQIEATCTADGCGTVQYFWEDQLKIGARWSCVACNAKYEIRLGMVKLDAPQEDSSDPA